MKTTPNIKKLFKNENLVEQKIYRAKKKYKLIYVNKELYEELFDEKYEYETAKEKLENMFSVTLNEEMSTGEIIGEAFADRQFDPSNIALSGNQGSGRAFFFLEHFNVKGDKTNLATAVNPIYSNGKFALTAAVKETITANIISEDFVIKSFSVLALLETNEKYDFVDEYLDVDDSIKTRVYNLPCAIEIRVNKEKELYRLSNTLMNEDKITVDYLEALGMKLAVIEANKFCDRFLHGSWSVGNISTDGNMIDFDTATFVKGRFPQYSNTNKYKSNYFGYELIGQKMMLDSIIEHLQIDNLEETKNKIKNMMDSEYDKNIKIRFCDLLGLNYQEHYFKYNKKIDKLCEKFCYLSKKFRKHYYATNVYEPDSENTYIFDFSNFFQKYLLFKDTTKSKFLLALKLLLNETYEQFAEATGLIKEKVESYFCEDLVADDEVDSLISEGMNFIEEYDELFNQIQEACDLKEIIEKQYFINSERKYLYAYNNVYSNLLYLYQNEVITSRDLNLIIDALITTNKRNVDLKENKLFELCLYEECLTFFEICEDGFKMILRPFEKIEIDFAKANICGKERMMRHQCDDGTFYKLESDIITIEELKNVKEFNVEIKINGKKCKKIPQT